LLHSGVIPLRPAGGAWSNVRDLLKVVEMELARGVLPDGRRWSRIRATCSNG
jgi:hypothetical protein